MTRPILLVTAQHTGTRFLMARIELATGRRVSTFPAFLATQGSPARALHVHVDHVAMGHLEGALKEAHGIATLRDPVLAMLSKRAREQGHGTAYLVQCFLFLERLRSQLTFIPIDRPELGRARFREWCQRAGGEEPDHPEWKASSVGPRTNLERYRASGSLDDLDRAGIEALLAAREVLVPFLQENGYDALPWFTA